MSNNPFIAKNDMYCMECSDYIQKEERVFAASTEDGSMYVCNGCAVKMNIVCECGNAKGPKFKQCYACHANGY